MAWKRRWECWQARRVRCTSFGLGERTGSRRAVSGVLCYDNSAPRRSRKYGFLWRRLASTWRAEILRRAGCNERGAGGSGKISGTSTKCSMLQMPTGSASHRIYRIKKAQSWTCWWEKTISLEYYWLIKGDRSQTSVRAFVISATGTHFSPQANLFSCTLMLNTRPLTLQQKSIPYFASSVPLCELNNLVFALWWSDSVVLLPH